MIQSSLYIGTSGWSYPHWSKGVFYPAGLRQGDWLGFYTSVFDSVEINTTFYRMPRPAMIRRCLESTNDDYRFAAKLWRRVTHVKRLQLSRIEVEDFCQALAPLGSRLGPLLVQLPPDQRRDLPRLKAFLTELAEARNQIFTRVVLEVRNPEWVDTQLYKILDNFGISLCLSDLPRCVVTEPNDLDFVYIRRHGPPGDHRGPYQVPHLTADAEWIQSFLDAGKDVFIYYNNDAQGYAPDNARALAALLGQDRGPGNEAQPSLPL